jgi:hypothetical protein
MKSSASSYYTSEDEDDYYNDYGTGTLAPSDVFESEKIHKKPSDIKKINLSHISNNDTTSGVNEENINTKINTTQLLNAQSSTTSENSDSNSDSTNKFPKLLFSSPSATVTSNGPSVNIFQIYY